MQQKGLLVLIILSCATGTNACGILAVFPDNSDHFNITSFQFLTEGFAYEAFAASYNHLHL